MKKLFAANPVQNAFVNAFSNAFGNNLRKSIPLVMGGRLMSEATVTRNSLAWDWNSQGLLQQFAINEPVIGYNPATGALRGLQVWPAVTNSLLQNRTLTGWTNNGATQDAVGADGVANKAWTLTDTDDVSRALTVSNNSQTNPGYWLIEKGEDSAILSMTYSGGTGLSYIATLDTSTGIATASGDAVSGNITVTDAGNWWEVKLAAANNSTGNTTLTIMTDVDGGSGTIVQDFPGIYLNTAPGLVVPIETGASAVPRAADNISITSIPWFNSEQGTIVFRGIHGAANSTAQYGYMFHDGTAGNSLALRRLTSSSQMNNLASSGGTIQASMSSTTTIAVNTVYGNAFAYALNDFAASTDGEAAKTDTSGDLPIGIDTVLIGLEVGGAMRSMAGWISDLIYYPVRLPNAQLQALSSG
jgi:hypothetical protein